jgi:histone acetyltransferase (RNA polymerase elongator complex component)
MAKNSLLIAPIFIPHEGCPYRCVFCNQVDITGSKYLADQKNVMSALKTYLDPSLQSGRYLRREVAFYGGSFTGLSNDRQEYLLSLIKPLIDDGRIDGIRVSTHPLFVQEIHLKRLKASGADTVELGVQSTNQKVLELSGRPCSKENLLKAVFLIRKYEFKLGLQLMLGLPGDNEKTFQSSVLDTIKMKPDFVRLYPALVLRHTALYSMYQKGSYKPWSLERTIDSLKIAVKLFNSEGIPIIRIGLQPDNSLKNNLIDGPFHPSIRYLVDCEIGLDLMIDKILLLDNIPKHLSFRVPKNMISIYTGNKRKNIKIIKDRFGLDKVSLFEEDLCKQVELVA